MARSIQNTLLPKGQLTLEGWRVKALTAQHPGGPELVPFLLEHWTALTGPGWEQEDDTTTIILQRVPGTSQHDREEV